MKKLLLSMAAVALLGGTAMADSFDITFSKADWPNISAYDKDITSTTEFGNSSWTSKNMNNNNGAWGYFRFGAKSTENGTASIVNNSPLSVKVESVVVNISNMVGNGNVTAASLLVSDDNMFSNPTTYSIDKSITAAGDYTFTVTDPATEKYYKLLFTYTNSTTKNGVADISKVTFNYTVEEGAVAQPTFKMEEDEYGYQVVLSAEEGATIYYTTDGTEPTTSSTKYTMPFDVWEATEVKAIAELDGKTSTVATFNADPKMIVDDFSALYGFVDFVPSTGVELVIKGRNYTAVYQAPSKQYLYLYDGQNYMLFYGTQDEITPGTLFNRAEGLFKVYNGLPEMTNTTLTATEGIGNVPAPAVMEDLEMVQHNLVNHYVKIEDLKLTSTTDEDGTTYTLTDKEGKSVVLYNRFNLAFEDYDACTVTGFISVYGDTVQIYPTEIVETESNGVAEVGVENAPVEYYNLQGVRVANPTEGIYVVRQGSKVYKAVVK